MYCFDRFLSLCADDVNLTISSIRESKLCADSQVVRQKPAELPCGGSNPSPRFCCNDFKSFRIKLLMKDKGIY